MEREKAIYLLAFAAEAMKQKQCVRQFGTQGLRLARAGLVELATQHGLPLADFDPDDELRLFDPTL